MRTLTSRAWPLLLCAALAFVSMGAGAQPAGTQPVDRRVDLRPKFERGQSIRFKMDVANTSTPAAPATTTRPPATTPRPEQMRSKIELGLSLKVMSVTDSREATVEMVFDSIKASTHTKDQDIEFDSTKPGKDGDDIAGLLFQGLEGSTLTLKVDRDGNITSVTGGEAFGTLGQFLGGGGGAGQLFGPLFSIKKGNGIVSVGESWEDVDQIDNSMLGKFKMTTRNTLRSVAGADAMVDVVGRIEPSSEAPGEGVAQIKDSRFGGKYAWDTKLGMLRQMDTTMTVNLEQTVAGVKTATKNESVMKITRVR